MGENIPMDEMEGYDIANEDLDDAQLREAKYFLDIFDTISDNVISDEYYNKNEELFGVITEMFFDINERAGNIPPEMARRILEGIFSNILKHGLR